MSSRCFCPSSSAVARGAHGGRKESTICQHRSGIAEVGPLWVDTGRKWVEPGPNLTEFDQAWPASVQVGRNQRKFGPNSAINGPTLFEIAHAVAEAGPLFHRARPKLTESCPVLASVRPEIATTCQLGLPSAQTWSKSSQGGFEVGPDLADRGPNLVEAQANLADPFLSRAVAAERRGWTR